MKWGVIHAYALKNILKIRWPEPGRIQFTGLSRFFKLRDGNSKI